ncbi:MAG TPA: ATP-binding protein [Caulobacteraceae bacterium]|nr:ATP-binding protein [Caulobacteraceae bacterium]
MAGRAEGDSGRSEAEGQGLIGARRGTGSPLSAGVRITLFSCLLLLALYVLYLTLQMNAGETLSSATSDAATQSALAGGQADKTLANLRAALNATANARARMGGDALDAAEAGLAATDGAAQAMAVASDGDVLAAAGSLDAQAPAWREAAEAARQAGRPFWAGSVKDGAGAYYAVAMGPPGSAPDGQGRSYTIAAGVPAKLFLAALDFGKGPLAQAVASPDGRLLAATGPRRIAGAQTLADAFAVTPADLKAAGGGVATARGTLADVGPVTVTVRPIAGGALVSAVVEPGPSMLNAEARSKASFLFSLLAPLAAGCGLAIMLVRQGQQTLKAREAMAVSEERFRLAVDAARCGIWEWDLKSDKVFISDVTGVILGWGGGGVAGGEDVLARVAADHRDRVRQALLSASVYGAFDVSFRVPDRHGKTAWVDARGQAYGRQEDGGYQRIVGVAFDVTEERMSQARAQAAETRLRDAIESASEAFVLWDRAGRLLMCNRNYREVFSLEPRLLKPGAPRETVERYARLAIRREIPESRGAKGVLEAELNDGRWIQISERPTADGGLVMTAADITAIKLQEQTRKLNEEALQKAVTSLKASQEQLAELARKYEAEKVRAESANKAKSEFLANMSHELRTPLNAINGFSEIMVGELFGPLGDARYKEYAGDILSSGQHLLSVINDILDMSKIEAGKMTLRFERIDLQEVAEDAVRLIRNRAETAGLKVVIDMPGLPEVDADFRALKQVLLNLLSNALKFTPRGGQIRVFGRVGIDGRGAERVLVGVQDTGIGISKEDLARLARPFEQVESQHAKTQQGTGLGLALTKSLIEMHGGLIDMKSEPGKGTTVSFILSVRQAGLSAEHAA